MSHDFWSFVPFLLSTADGDGKKVRWIRVLETVIGAVIISLIVSYITVQKMEVELKYVWKELSRHEAVIEGLRKP